MEKKRILTALQPSGALHIGNYFGALRPLVELTKVGGNETFLMVADYHALTSLKDATALRENIYNIVRAYLAVGADSKDVVLFRQSDNPDHTELGWIFNCLVTVPFLMQAHSYKDKIAKGLDANAGLFTYPMLMAADIALYDVDLVPVGEDQRQHVEYAREAVTKFNLAFGETLKEPKEMIRESVGIVPGTDGQKMSKSYKNTIPLFGTPEELEKAVMGIVTDSSGDVPQNVYAIHQVVAEGIGKSGGEIDALYEANKGKYKILKDALHEDLKTLLNPFAEKYQSITDEEIKNLLAEGVEKAKVVSNETMRKVREATGISI